MRNCLPIKLLNGTLIASCPNKEDYGDNKGDGGDGTGEPNPQNGDGNGEGSGQFDSHAEWGKVSHQAKEIAKERLKEAVKKASQECEGGKGWGSVSSTMRREISLIE